MKTRLQLQGELVKADANVKRVYNNVFDVFRKTWKNEGIRGLQRGLFPAYIYQTLLNGSRLGEFGQGGGRGKMLRDQEQKVVLRHRWRHGETQQRV